MAALALPHRSAPVEWPIQMESWAQAEPQGAEDRQLRANAQCAVAHWKSRAEYLLAESGADEGYVSVPFKPVKKVHVTYRQIGVLKPAPYPLDE
jgi:hypothetical protein